MTPSIAQESRMGAARTKGRCTQKKPPRPKTGRARKEVANDLKEIRDQLRPSRHCGFAAGAAGVAAAGAALFFALCALVLCDLVLCDLALCDFIGALAEASAGAAAAGAPAAGAAFWSVWARAARGERARAALRPMAANFLSIESPLSVSGSSARGCSQGEVALPWMNWG